MTFLAKKDHKPTEAGNSIYKADKSNLNVKCPPTEWFADSLNSLKDIQALHVPSGLFEFHDRKFHFLGYNICDIWGLFNTRKGGKDVIINSCCNYKTLHEVLLKLG